MDHVIFIVAAGAIAAGFVQGLTGFAYAQVAVSFWVWTLDPKLTAALAVFGALTGQIIGAVTVRRGFHLRTLLPFVAGGALGIPLGVALLPSLDIYVFKASIGTFLVTCCPLMLAARNLPRVRRSGRITDTIAGGLGGIMCGIGGFAGTLPTLWCTLRGFDKDEQRAVIQNFNLAALSVTMAIYLARGLVTRDMLPMFAVAGTAMLIPVILGTRVYTGISETMFRTVVLGCLTVSGVALLVSAVPHFLGR